MNADAPFIVWVIVLPLLAATLAVLIGQRSNAWRFAALLATLAAVAGLVWQVAGEGPQSYALAGWQPPLGIRLSCDGLAATMLLVTAAINTAVYFYAGSYFHLHQHRDHDKAGSSPKSTSRIKKPESAPAGRDAAARFFWPLWLLLWGSLNALFLSADLFNLYITLELVTLAAVALVALAGSAATVRAALRYLVAAFIGSLAYLAGVALLYGDTGVLDLAILREVVRPGLTSHTAAALMLAGLALKTALFPLHFWLPAAHAGAPAPVSALLSALVVKASYYIALRLWIDVLAAALSPTVVEVIGGLAAAGILWGSVQALVARRLKLMVAYSTVAQLGYLFSWFALADRADPRRVVMGAGMLVIAHAGAKAALFLAAGTVLHAAGHDEISRLDRVARRLPRTMFAIGLAGVSLMGLPPTAGFAAKWLLLEAAIDQGRWFLVAVVMLGGLLTAAYTFRVVRLAFVTPSSDVPPQRLAPSLVWTPLALALVMSCLGLAAAPLCELLAVGRPAASVESGEEQP
jgi:multicomponent Na+:H+ antiporter subunit D